MPINCCQSSFTDTIIIHQAIKYLCNAKWDFQRDSAVKVLPQNYSPTNLANVTKGTFSCLVLSKQSLKYSYSNLQNLLQHSEQMQS